MNASVSFRTTLPSIQTVIAVVVGGIGAWQRNQILSRPFLDDQTLWETTARYHVWPWPLKFAAIVNLPPLIASALASLPLQIVFKRSFAVLEAALAIGVAFVFWRMIAIRLEHIARRSSRAKQAVWSGLGVFMTASLAGALAPLGYVGYVPFGMALWIIATATLIFATKHGNAQAH